MEAGDGNGDDEGDNGSHFLGTQGISLRVCGAENPSQGPWEPGALGAALILGGLETAGGALQLPFPSL